MKWQFGQPLCTPKFSTWFMDAPKVIDVAVTWVMKGQIGEGYGKC